MKKLFFTSLFLAVTLLAGTKQKSLDAFLKNSAMSSTGTLVEIGYTIAPGYHIYADMISIDAPSNVKITPVNVPAPVKIFDPLGDEKRAMYTNDFTAKYLLKSEKFPVKIILKYQGCDKKVCFMPVEKEVEISGAESSIDKKSGLSKTRRGGLSTTCPESEAARGKNVDKAGGGLSTTCPESEAARGKNVDRAGGAQLNWQVLSEKFKVVGKKSGYLSAKDFLSFLDATESGRKEKSAADIFMSQGLLLSIILIILGGAALNLTPCVLPMIPINLAIIGAGTQSSSKKRGFLLGGIYGIGIALTYGALGLVVVLSGSQFGTLNSSAWFNFSIAAVFIVLALAMFDVIMIDFTKYQHSATEGKIKKGTFFTAFFMGCVAALLAGACVAPVVIYVLLLSASLYAKGLFVALFLPFLLGLGMGLPWPFAGAGLSFLPKPGVWMTRVKYAFGVLILLFALYYGHLGYSLLNSPAKHTGQSNNLEKQFAESLRRALDKNKPVIIDFWATWCKNCTAMEKTTFKNHKVIDRLKSYEFIKVQAEHPDKEPVKSILKYYEVPGLPTYVILNPVNVQ